MTKFVVCTSRAMSSAEKIEVREWLQRIGTVYKVEILREFDEIKQGLP